MEDAREIGRSSLDCSGRVRYRLTERRLALTLGDLVDHSYADAKVDEAWEDMRTGKRVKDL